MGVPLREGSSTMEKCLKKQKESIKAKNEFFFMRRKVYCRNEFFGGKAVLLRKQSSI